MPLYGYTYSSKCSTVLFIMFYESFFTIWFHFVFLKIYLVIP